MESITIDEAKQQLELLEKERVNAKLRYDKGEIDKSALFRAYRCWLSALNYYTVLVKESE